MSLLSLEHVTLRYGRGADEWVVLREVCLELDPGELVGVWGLRHSGRSTLLRVAAGIEPPSSGVVRFQGNDLARRCEHALGGGIGYCQGTFRSARAQPAIDELMLGPLARGVTPPEASAQAHAALERVAAPQCAGRALYQLDGAERVRVSLARALALKPSLLVIDDPTDGVELLERDAILLLLRGLADEGIAVLMSAVDGLGLSGADRALTLSQGTLHGHVAPELAQVLPLRQANG
jgi:ABC-type cobalamin/Fe3+-siderophores transport system ATPase subunit